LKQVPFVEEQNHCRVGKPLGIADVVKNKQGFLKTIHSLVFVQYLNIHIFRLREERKKGERERERREQEKRNTRSYSESTPTKSTAITPSKQ